MVALTIVDIPAVLGLGYWQWRERVKKDVCPYCTVKPPKRLRTIEHITPRSCGGADDASNTVGACHSCNTRRNSEPLLLYLLARLDADP